MGGMRDTPRTHAIGTDLYDIRPPAIRVAGLTKRFGDLTALAGVDLEVPAGSVLGLLGPNGAGKTTTVRILTTVIAADGGTAEVLGIDVARSPDAVRDRFGLTDAANRPVRTYSGGMRRRLDVAAALVHRPPVLFLDEPTTGLDPFGRSNLWEVIEDLAADGTTVLLTTQYLEEADRLADDIVVIDGGRVIAEGTPTELKARLGSTVVELGLAGDNDAVRATAVLAPFGV